MKAHFLCTFESKECFWVETNFIEARWILRYGKNRKIIPSNQTLLALDDPRNDTNYYFLIAFDLSLITQMNRDWFNENINFYTQSWLTFKPFNFWELEELSSKYETIIGPLDAILSILRPKDPVKIMESSENDFQHQSNQSMEEDDKNYLLSLDENELINLDNK